MLRNEARCGVVETVFGTRLHKFWCAKLLVGDVCPVYDNSAQSFFEDPPKANAFLYTLL